MPLIDILTGHGIEIEFETNGTRVPDPRLIRAGVRFNVSPKLSHSGDPERARIVPTALRRFATLPEATFKFVCRTEADLDEVAELVSAMGITSVWIMPEGQDPQHVSRHMQDLAASVIERGWNITTRLHTLLWGQKRGV